MDKDRQKQRELEREGGGDFFQTLFTQDLHIHLNV